MPEREEVPTGSRLEELQTSCEPPETLDCADPEIQGKLGRKRTYGHKAAGCPSWSGRRWRHGGAIHAIVERVALDGDPAGGANQAFEVGAGEAFGRGGAGVVINIFLDDGSIEIVRAETESDLRDALGEHDPVGLDVIEIVEHEARDGDGF